MVQEDSYTTLTRTCRPRRRAGKPPEMLFLQLELPAGAYFAKGTEFAMAFPSESAYTLKQLTDALHQA